MLSRFKKRYIIPVILSGFLFTGVGFKEDFFEIAKQIEILINYKRICHSHKASSRPLCELCLMKNTLQLFPGDE